MPIIARLEKKFTIQAAHFLPKVHASHKCKNIHGHSYNIIIACQGRIDEEKGWHIDLDDLRIAFEPIRKNLDHKLLNNILGLENPTSENLACYIINEIRSALPTLYSVTIRATDSAKVTIFVKDYHK